jgi:hypothetical protein
VPTEKPRGLRKLAELCYGAGPNVERMAAEAGWSEELTLEILQQHATANELPRRPKEPLVPAAGKENVIYLRERPGRGTATPAPPSLSAREV